MNATASTGVEDDIAAKVKAAGIRLRFDKVVLRLVANVKQVTIGLVREDETVLFTVTAPIRLPSKTATAIAGMVRDGLPNGDLQAEICGNHVTLCHVKGVADAMPRVLGFVHNSEADAGLILAIAGSCLA